MHQPLLIEHLDRLILFRPARLRVLVVADSAVTFDTSFGLGMMIDTLRDPAYSFVRFEVTLARRDGSPAFTSAPGPHEPTYRGFRFDRAEADGSPTLDKYHQVWCFGFEPGNDGGPDANISDPQSNPTSDLELAALARWMNERQGGVFATGDHDYLGASMCSRIPRVGTMRRWTNAQGVPPIGGVDRLDTNRPATAGQRNIAGTPDVMPIGNEGDAVPQEIDWKRYYAPAGIWSHRAAPHPILCDGSRGVINIMPDHPHEGQVIEDADIVTSNTFSFSGYSGDEYPTAGGVQPRPEVIAWGTTLPDPPFNHAKGDSPAKRFAMIGVYDGQRAGVGRVVVDSTWHHWFDMNLVGMAADTTTDHYERIQTYYRNIGMWLATQAQRDRMLLAATWWSFHTVEAVEEYSIYRPIWELGRSARDVLGRYASRCQVREWVLELLPWKFREIYYIPELKPRPDPCLSCPPFELFEVAVLGGIVKALVPYVDRINRARYAGESVELDEKEIARAARSGAKDGLRALTRLAEASIGDAQEFAAALASAAEDDRKGRATAE